MFRGGKDLSREWSIRFSEGITTHLFGQQRLNALYRIGHKRSQLSHIDFAVNMVARA